ncbi:MAG: FecR domain-containing protein [Rhodoferax sp.]|uniref:FecR domain-containing protein n=1 Tax=Rhodoferax sp. TaxID=50421 RepID=UPI002ACDD35B|nr:FecR domain-containing protein [Rhodoferax sp.]MDZ7893204.1 FecR domain-containing protein [Rhodoferax sp.]
MSNRRQFIANSVAISSLGGLVDALAMGQRPLQSGIRRIKGEVFLNGGVARIEQAILPGDTISTGALSETVFVMGDNAYLLREKSSLQFAQDEVVSVLRLISGKALAVFGPGPKRIETRAATVGIRGTACYMEAQEIQLYFCLCYGTADIKPLANPGLARSVTTRYHDMPMYISYDSSQPVLRPAPVINHRDSELVLLEETVGRQPPFVQKPAGEPSRY